MTNPNCDNDKCNYQPNYKGAGVDPNEVRVLPLGTDPNHGNIIVCFECYCHEIAYRNERSKELSPESQYKHVKWADLKVYTGE